MRLELPDMNWEWSHSLNHKGGDASQHSMIKCKGFSILNTWCCKFYHNIALAASCKLCSIFIIILISLWLLLWSMDYLELCGLLYFQILESFLGLLWSLISNLIPQWPENMFYIILILLNLLRFVLWPSIWSIGEHTMYTLKNVCLTVWYRVL